eukprot:TRINITY_DN66822_c4_g4_i1.p1 TRINITY_DN66822_c4_g4~~TRINITY_DN66822_c4_g4_i1.p1  ORF type:complete len:183 (-),score=12.53 TRINITY_DN66822_c4_g4_i1:102-650(-)
MILESYDNKEYPHWVWDEEKKYSDPEGTLIASLENCVFTERLTRPKPKGRLSGVSMYGDSCLSVTAYRRSQYPDVGRLIAGLLDECSDFDISFERRTDKPTQSAEPLQLLQRFGEGWQVSGGNCGVGPDKRQTAEELENIENVDDLICPDVVYADGLRNDGNFWDLVAVGRDFLYHYRFFTS